MPNDPQIIARNRSELQKLKEERIQEEDRVALPQKEAGRLAAQKEDLEVERVLISQSQNQLRAKQEEVSKQQKKIEEISLEFEKKKQETEEKIGQERQELKQANRELEEQTKELERRTSQLDLDKAEWEKQKQFDLTQQKSAQEQFEQKRSREENEIF